MNKFKF